MKKLIQTLVLLLAATAVIRGAVALADEPLGAWYACMSNCANLYTEKEAQRQAWWASVPHNEANWAIYNQWMVDNDAWLHGCRIDCGPKPEDPPGGG